MVKSCKLLNDEANAEERESSALGAMICSSSDEESDWEATDIAKTSNTFNTAGNENAVVNVEIILDDAVASITQHQTCLEQCSDFNIASVKCAAHTLQLAVTDVLKRSQFSNTVEVARKVVKKTRNQNLRLVFHRRQQSLPILDCETRWGSTYIMLESICKCKNFLNELSFTNETLLITEEQWNTIEGIVIGLKQVYILSKVLQTKSLTAGHFFGTWIKTKLVLNSLLNSPICAFLSQAMTSRETSIVENPAFLGAVFLDLRY